MNAIMFAVNWEPELRGVLTVLIGVVVWFGSVYLILATNMGARLGVIVTLAAFFGWMALMGATWWMYGIGYLGAAPSWQPVEGAAVIQDVGLLHQAGVLDADIDVDAQAPGAEAAYAVEAQLVEEQGWTELDETDPAYGQAVSAADVLLLEEGAFAGGDYKVTTVFEVNPPEETAFPAFGPNNEFDQLAFFHEPYYTLVEVAPLEPVRAEAGRAPIAPEVDLEAQRQYVYMVRDLGSVRQPAAFLTVGSALAFLSLCYLMHRRDQFVAANLARKAPAVT